MTSRLLVGLSVGSGMEGVDAALIRFDGVGLTASPTVERFTRTPFLPLVREVLRTSATVPVRDVAETAAAAVRQLVTKSGIDLRSVLLVGLMTPNRRPIDGLAEHLAERTGVTVVTRFAGRDVAAGGAGRPLTPASDYLFARSPTDDRLLIHLGHVTSVLLIPANGQPGDLIGFDAGPGNHLLDATVRLGTREKEPVDVGGTKAVQGRCVDELLDGWRTHPHLFRTPPKPLDVNEFGDTFVATAFDSARRSNAGLADLLCTMTHFVSLCVGGGCRQFVPPTDRPRGIFVSGGGVRNGFLWQLVQQHFPGTPLRRTDDLGIPALGRTAAAAGVLAALTLDGVTSNLPLLTGASGGRLIGRLVPGDPRNWAAVTAWAAEQLWDYNQLSRAA